MADALWPWLALAGAGALHGLNPLAGWAFAAWPATAGAPTPARWLLSVAAGHLGAVLLVAAAMPLALRLGVGFEPWVPQALAIGLLLVVVLRHCSGGAGRHAHASPARAALALWSFVLGMGHGAGWMLLPALASICMSDAPGREVTASGSLLLGVAAVAVHLAAMLAVMLVVAAGARRVFAAMRPAGAPPEAGCSASSSPASDAGAPPPAPAPMRYPFLF